MKRRNSMGWRGGVEDCRLDKGRGKQNCLSSQVYERERPSYVEIEVTIDWNRVLKFVHT